MCLNLLPATSMSYPYPCPCHILHLTLQPLKHLILHTAPTPHHHPHSITPTPSSPLHHPHSITPTPSPPLHSPHSITPTGQIERRDALRLNVDCIRIHMSRSTPKSASRYAHVDPTTSTSGGAVGPTPSADEGRKGRVRFSLLCEIGAASFTYDMRRLMEILAFPKAWYSRVLVRHLFFGSSYSDLPDG